MLPCRVLAKEDNAVCSYISAILPKSKLILLKLNRQLLRPALSPGPSIASLQRMQSRPANPLIALSIVLWTLVGYSSPRTKDEDYERRI
jgi:hypothetical protein